MSKNRNPISKVLCWVARILSIASILMLAMFIFGPQEQGQFQSLTEVIGFSFFPVGIIIGMGLGWWKEWVGGAITVISLVAFYVWHFVVSGGMPTGPYFLIFAVPGILFLLSAITRHQRPASKNNTGAFLQN